MQLALTSQKKGTYVEYLSLSHMWDLHKYNKELTNGQK